MDLFPGASVDFRRVVADEVAVRGISWSELARRSGVGLSHLRKWARGIKGMSSDNLGRIMAALEIR